MDYITNHWSGIVEIFTGVVTLASIIVRMTPSKFDDSVVSKLMQFLSMNRKMDGK